MRKLKKNERFITIALSLSFLFLVATLIMQMDYTARTVHLQVAPITTLAGDTTAVSAVPQESISTAFSDTYESTEAPTASDTQRSEMYADKTEKPTQTVRTTQVHSTKPAGERHYDKMLILNTNSKKIHSSWCSYAQNMKPANRKDISSAEVETYLGSGYTVCARCKALERA